MSFSIDGRIYHSIHGIALIVHDPAVREQLRQYLGSHDIFFH